MLLGRITFLLVASLVLTVVPVVPGMALEPEPPEVRAADQAVPAADEVGDGVSGAEAPAPVVEAEHPFNMIGFKLPEGVEGVMVRTALAGGEWSPWSRLEVDVEGLDGPDPDSEEARQATPNVTAPLWAGEADRFQVRVDGAAPGEVTATIVDATGLSEPITKRIVRHLMPRQAPAEARVGRPDIVTREEWGANEGWVKRSPSIASKIDHVVVHHTANGNDYSREDGPALVRSIHYWHTQANGWNDIGYNMLVDRYGVVYEGRAGGLDRAVVGAHAAGFNTGSFGISVIGNFDQADIPNAAYASLVQSIGWKMRLHGMNLSPSRTFTKNGKVVNTISGHRDVGYTACPGRYLYQRLDTLRGQVATAGMPATGGTPVVGDWDGDGVDTPGIYAKGTFYLRNSNTAGYPEFVVPFGAEGDRPIVGDWNGNGVTGIGVVRGGTWMLRDTITPGPPNREFVFGRVLSGDRPIVGDWNKDGTDGIGIVRSGGEWHLRHRLTAGYADLVFVYGRVAGGDFPMTGDWSGNGRTTVGIVRGPDWMLKNGNAAGDAEQVIRFGRDGDVPIVGDWNGDGRQAIGVVRGRTWYLNDGITDGYAQTTFRF
ncbi:MAG: N-acetylmuramoyl-L-alanine amidase [Actinomycetota bacterium]